MESLAAVPIIDQLVRAALAHAGAPVNITRPRPGHGHGTYPGLLPELGTIRQAPPQPGS